MKSGKRKGKKGPEIETSPPPAQSREADPTPKPDPDLEIELETGFFPRWFVWVAGWFAACLILSMIARAVHR